MPSSKPTALSRIFDGVLAPLRGADFLLRHPTLMRYALAPFVLSFLLLSLILWLTVDHLLVPFHHYVAGLLHLTGWLLTIFEILLWPAAIAAYLVLAGFVFTALANLLAGPFNERLSLRTEELVTDKAESAVYSFREALHHLGHTMAIELKKIGFFLLLQMLLMSVWLFPVAGQVAYPILAGLVTIWFLATEFLDYPMERRHISYRMRLLFEWSHRYEIFGFGASIALWLLVPLVGFVALPVSVVGGTLLYLKAIER